MKYYWKTNLLQRLTLMYKCIIFAEAVQMHIPSATDDNIRTAIASWLDNSKTRLKNELA